MKFQTPSFKFFLNGRTDGRTNGRTSRKQYAPNFFKVGGIKIRKTRKHFEISVNSKTLNVNQKQ